MDYLYARLPMFSRVGAPAIKKGLHNIEQLLKALGNPQDQFKVIHLAGTNGKGSCSHLMAAILQAHGYSTGLYTSPHLRDFRERIRINGALVEEVFVVDFVEQIKPHIEALEPSFFEVTVAMAFQWFAQQKIDVAVIETGLGGRLDSTNVVEPELSIITNIGYDHMALLGDTLDKIAFEKAGIIKQGVPVVVGELLPETEPVFRAKAAQMEAELVAAEAAYAIRHIQSEIDRLQVQLEHKVSGKVYQYQTDLPGLYQQYNLRTVRTACDVLLAQGWDLREEHIAAGMANAAASTGLEGRWQLIHRQPFVVLDVAHNEAGLRQLLTHVRSFEAPGRNIWLVYGTSADKDLDAMLPMLPKHYRYAFTQADMPRAMPHRELAHKAAAAGLHGQAYARVMDALQAVASTAAQDDLVLVCGSVFVVGEVDVAAARALFLQGPPTHKK